MGFHCTFIELVPIKGTIARERMGSSIVIFVGSVSVSSVSLSVCLATCLTG